MGRRGGGARGGRCGDGTGWWWVDGCVLRGDGAGPEGDGLPGVFEIVAGGDGVEDVENEGGVRAGREREALRRVTMEGRSEMGSRTCGWWIVAVEMGDVIKTGSLAWFAIGGVPLLEDRITGNEASGFLIPRAAGKMAAGKAEKPHFSLMTGISSRLDVCSDAS